MLTPFFSAHPAEISVAIKTSHVVAAVIFLNSHKASRTSFRFPVFKVLFEILISVLAVFSMPCFFAKSTEFEPAFTYYLHFCSWRGRNFSDELAIWFRALNLGWIFLFRPFIVIWCQNEKIFFRHIWLIKLYWNGSVASTLRITPVFGFKSNVCFPTFFVKCAYPCVVMSDFDHIFKIRVFCETDVALHFFLFLFFNIFFWLLIMFFLNQRFFINTFILHFGEFNN